MNIAFSEIKALPYFYKDIVSDVFASDVPTLLFIAIHDNHVSFSFSS